MLAEHEHAWYYMRNLGSGTFAPAEAVATVPAIAQPVGAVQQVMDLDGDGQVELVQYAPLLAGFHARSRDGAWEGFRPFRSVPNIAWRDPDLRFVDLTGDGFPDVLISQDHVFSWHASLAREGFGPEQRTTQASDEEKGPRLVFSDPTQSIFLADMSADGLSDIVRVRNGDICYWPNLGYGRFGAKVAMGNAPVLDAGDRFDPRRVRLADIDGSGTSDIVYLGDDEIRLYFNRAGNAWSDVHALTHYPPGGPSQRRRRGRPAGQRHGLPGLVHAAARRDPPADALHRPHGRHQAVPAGVPDNHMGAQTRIDYATSTRFYLEDRAAGRAWAARLPFPVHVIARVEHRDLVSDSTLVTTYRYRHGYYDGVEREFRGFAFVEQRDTESVDASASDTFDLPPVVTRSWFHTGAFLDRARLEAWFRDPEHREYFLGDPAAVFLPDAALPDGDLSAAEMREACRALKGSLLRQETYADDGTAEADKPYGISQHSYGLRRLQPRGANHHGAFLRHADQSLSYHYERHVDDPRIQHALTLEVDAFGHVTRSAAVGYGRRQPDPDLDPADQARRPARWSPPARTA